MRCPRCGATMKVDTKIPFDNDKPLVIYYCPKCGEMAHK